MRCKLKRVSEDYQHHLAGLIPPTPEGISDRAADNWEPLLAIAGLAGGDWPQKAMQAALALSARDNDATSLGTELLMDIENIFVGGVTRITTAELIEKLCADEERPWATYNRGKQIAPRQVAKLLKEYGIHSKNLKQSYGVVAKGYEQAQFADAFQRYLAPPENSRYPLPEADTLGFGVAEPEAVAATHTDNATENVSISAAGSGRTDNFPVAPERVEFAL